ncbi:MAG: hypothetical protein EKK34_32055 [Mycobacterium sp.]|nr:MAG: hypothetical protein EKK34_32055 [Mycobacterium sp.]
MNTRSGDTRPQPSSRRSTGRRLVMLSILPLAAAVMATNTAYADPAGGVRAEGAGNTRPSYQLGYTKTFNDLDILARRARAEGLALEDLDFSSRIPAVCAREAQSVGDSTELNGPDFLRGCADGINSLVRAGLVS